MRALALTSLLSLAGCLMYTQPEPAYPPPSTPPPARGPGPEAGPQSPPPPGERAALTEQQAVDAAFRVARERGLVVDQVKRAHLDAEGRWRVDLRGAYDRALVLLDARDGRLLKGKFRAKAGRPRR